MQLLSATVHHFKGFSGEVEFDFDKITEFIADNEKGKTSILDMVAFVFTGLNCFGERSDFIYKDKYTCWVKLVVKDANGDVREIKRTQQMEKETGKTSSEVRVDLNIVTSTTLSDFIDSDIFLSIINPKFFQNLSGSKAKNLLLDITNIDRKDVEKNLDEETKKQLAGEAFAVKDIDDLKSALNKEAKKLDEKATSNQNAINGLNAIKVSDEELKETVFDESQLDDALLKLSKGEINIKEIQALLKERDEALRSNVMKNSLSMTKKQITEKTEILTKEMEEAKTESKKIKDKVKAYDVYKSKNMILVKETIETYLKNVKIQLTEKTTEGKEKDVFNILYKGKDINICSNAEQIKAGLEISQMIMSLTGVSYPLFIDNAESITKLPQSEKIQQIITMAVQKGYELSTVEGAIARNVKTKKTMPRIDRKSVV